MICTARFTPGGMAPLVSMVKSPAVLPAGIVTERGTLATLDGLAAGRVRLGIGHPGIKERVHGYVLSDFAKDERPWVAALCEAIADNAGLLAAGRDSTFQNKVHLAMQAKGFFDANDDGGK